MSNLTVPQYGTILNPTMTSGGGSAPYEDNSSMAADYFGTKNSGESVGSSGYSISPSLDSSKVPSVVDYGQIDDKTYRAIMNDTSGKYIGSKPVKAKLQTPDAARADNYPTAGQVADTATPQTKDKNTTADTIGTVAGMVGNEYMKLAQAKSNLTFAEGQEDLRQWQEKGKYWFDKEQDLKPDIEKYMAQMPSATDNLSKSTMSGGGNDALAWINGPINMGIEKALVNNGNEEWRGAGEYTTNKALEGAISGYSSGGWIGAVVGACLQTVMGIFTWNSAIETDEKNRKLYQEEFDRKLKEWTIARNRRLVAEQTKVRQGAETKVLEFKNKQENDKSQQASNKVASRQAMKSAILNSGNVRQSRLNRRAQRWGGQRAA